MTDAISFRPLNVALRPNSAAAKAYAAAARPPEPAAAGADTVEDALAAAHPLADGFKPQPGLDLKRHPGRLISDLVFTTRYLGGESSSRTTSRRP